MYTIPEENDIFLKKILKMIDGAYEPEIVDIIPENYAKNTFCHQNVLEKIKIDGGKIHFGWAIYKSNTMIEAEKHAVWESPNEDLIDITPNEANLKQIMFVPDNRVENVVELSHRINLSDSKAIDTLIDLFSIRHNLKTEFGEYNPLNQEITIPIDVINLINKINNQIIHYQKFIYFDINRLQKCYCGSGKSYNNCHANITINKLKLDVQSFKKNRK